MSNYVDRITMLDGITYLIRDAVSREASQEALDTAEAAAQDAARVTSFDVRLDYLEAVVPDLPRIERAVAELQACCETARETMAGFALALAALTESWQYSFGRICAPTDEACTVSDTTATAQGTVSETTLTLE